MAAQDYYGVVQQLYVSYFGRPADHYGLENFATQLEQLGAPKTFAELQAAVQADATGKSGLSLLVNSFNTSPESVALYGNDNSQLGVSKFIAAIYQNVLGREADVPGFNYWVGEVSSGRVSKANAAAAITEGALKNTSAQGLLDAKTVQNKVAIASAFTTALDTPSEWNAYSGETAAALARSLLTGVNSSTDLTAYQTTVNNVVNNVVSGQTPGQAVSLTAGVDTLVGTNGNDTFNALSVTAAGTAGDTLTDFDSIEGGGGSDTLNIYASNADNNVLPNQVSINNVETINIFNTGTTAAGLGDASKFVGATAIWQNVLAANVTNLAATTTAGFKGVTAATTGLTALTVSAAEAAASASIALNGVKGVAGAGANQNQATLAVNGAALNSVTVSGTLAKAATGTSAPDASLNLAVTAGEDVQTVKVNTAVKTTLTVANTGTKAVTAVDASASAGAVTYTSAADTVQTIMTGSGSDTVTISTATAIDNPATTATNETVNASLMTGAGNDTIVVAVGGAGLTTIDAGDGDDKVTVNGGSQNVTVTAGAGDDTITLLRGVGAKDVIDGGDGVDTLKISGTTLAAQDYEILKAVVSDVEGLAFAQGITADASKLTQFTELQFTAGTNTVTKVADAQTIVTMAAVTATAAGYAAGTNGGAATYAGTLTIEASATVIPGTPGTPGTPEVLPTDPDGIPNNGDETPGSPAVPGTPGTPASTAPFTVTANANAVDLTVSAVAATASAGGLASSVTLTGDLKTATVDLVNSTAAATGATANGDALATITVNTTATLANLTSLTLTGNGAAIVTATGGKLATIDASGMTGVSAADATKQVGGLNFTANAANAEVVTLGGGKDIVTTSSSYENMDTITGLTLVSNATGTTPSLDAAKSDDIAVGTNLTFAKATVSGATLGLALADAAAATAGNNLVFQYGGDTYVYVDNAAAAAGETNTVGTFGNGDLVVKLTGTIDLDLLVIALNPAVV